MEGDQIDHPPPLLSCWDTNLQHFLRFWKTLGLYLNNLQIEWQIFKNPNLVIKQKKQIKNCANCNKLFEKPLIQKIQVCKEICKILKPKNVFKKTGYMKIPFKGVGAKICSKFLCKIVQNACLC